MHAAARTPGRTRSVLALLVTVVAFAAAAVVVPVAAGASSSTHAVAASPTEVGDTTTTLPRDNRQLGEIIPQPNGGADPVNAGDPGGWLQVSLFFLICAAIFLMAGLVVFQSYRARKRRQAAGLDPVALAKATGKGVRAPSPLAGSGDAS